MNVDYCIFSVFKCRHTHTHTHTHTNTHTHTQIHTMLSFCVNADKNNITLNFTNPTAKRWNWAGLEVPFDSQPCVFAIFSIESIIHVFPMRRGGGAIVFLIDIPSGVHSGLIWKWKDNGRALSKGLLNLSVNINVGCTHTRAAAPCPSSFAY